MDWSGVFPAFLLVIAAAYLIAKFLHGEKYTDDEWRERQDEILDELEPLSAEWRPK